MIGSLENVEEKVEQMYLSARAVSDVSRQPEPKGAQSAVTFKAAAAAVATRAAPKRESVLLDVVVVCAHGLLHIYRDAERNREDLDTYVVVQAGMNSTHTHNVIGPNPCWNYDARVPWDGVSALTFEVHHRKSLGGREMLCRTQVEPERFARGCHRTVELKGRFGSAHSANAPDDVIPAMSGVPTLEFQVKSPTLVALQHTAPHLVRPSTRLRTSPSLQNTLNPQTGHANAELPDDAPEWARGLMAELQAARLRLAESRAARGVNNEAASSTDAPQTAPVVGAAPKRKAVTKKMKTLKVKATSYRESAKNNPGQDEGPRAVSNNSSQKPLLQDIIEEGCSDVSAAAREGERANGPDITSSRDEAS